ncbi:MAG TPA: hypothetical protein VH912_12115 [Streptosporangiaceae bacterium]
MRRTIRRLGFYRNEMCRPLDRAQSIIALAMVLVFLVLGPVAAARAVQHVYQSQADLERRQTAARQQVDAVVVRHLAPESSISGEVVGGQGRIQWRTADGSLRTGTADTGKPAGTHLTVWVDHSGAIKGAPQTRTQTLGTTSFAAAGALIAVALPLALGHALIRRRFDRRRLAGWDAEWSRVAPLWTRRG